MDRGAWQATGHQVARVGHDLTTNIFAFIHPTTPLHASTSSSGMWRSLQHLFYWVTGRMKGAVCVKSLTRRLADCFHTHSFIHEIMVTGVCLVPVPQVLTLYDALTSKHWFQGTTAVILVAYGLWHKCCLCSLSPRCAGEGRLSPSLGVESQAADSCHLARQDSQDRTGQMLLLPWIPDGLGAARHDKALWGQLDTQPLL